MRFLLAFALSACAAAQINILPLPLNLSFAPGCLDASALSISASGPGAGDAYLSAAIDRARRAIATAGTRLESVVAACDFSTAGQIAQLTVNVLTARAGGALPALHDDESYTLAVGAGATSLLTATTVWGALRGLETLTQLISVSLADPRVFVPAASVEIADAPRFTHRGLMIDTGRGFLPVSLINATLDAMAYVKLNVLHWHVSDDQAFPLESAVYPELIKGAMQAPARSHVYSAADVRSIVARAAERGIRVMAELDVPGHSTSWFAGYPSLATNCSLPPGSSFTVPMDPTLNSTYAFLSALFDEVTGAFPDALFHVGGDEVEMTCWNSDPAIAAFMAANGIPDTAQLQLYFERRLVAQLRAGRRAVIWEGNSGSQNAYPAGAIVHAWKERGGNLSVLEALIRANYTTLYTTPDWYMDWNTISKGYDPHINSAALWQFCHSIDPLGGTTLTPQQQRLLLGAEVCAWEPFGDAANFMSVTFPRAAAIAERLWSAPGAAVDEPAALLDRMRALRCRLLARGIGSAGVELGGSCPSTFDVGYTAPF